MPAPGSLGGLTRRVENSVAMRKAGVLVAVVAATAVSFWCAPPARASGDVPAGVTQATLSNGLQVIVVRNPLAPVVTAMMNYRVGSDEQWIDGLAHATEHMMFRGSATLSSSQLMDTIGRLRAATSTPTRKTTVTQYYLHRAVGSIWISRCAPSGRARRAC